MEKQQVPFQLSEDGMKGTILASKKFFGRDSVLTVSMANIASSILSLFSLLGSLMSKSPSQQKPIPASARISSSNL